MKSLIKLNSIGSKVSIVGSTFEKVASCGSIISNSQPYYRTETECVRSFTNTVLQKSCAALWRSLIRYS
jgi:hypothetical protein